MHLNILSITKLFRINIKIVLQLLIYLRFPTIPLPSYPEKQQRWSLLYILLQTFLGFLAAI